MVRCAGALLLGILLLGVPTLAVAQVMDPPVVIEGFERARSEGRLDVALSYFADDATVTVQDRVMPGLTGKDDIRRFLQSMRAAPVITSNRHVVGNTITWTERHDIQPNAPRTGMPRALELAVEAIVQDGKIKSLTYSLAGAAQPSTPVADAPGRLPAPYALGGVVVLASALLAAAFVLPRRRTSASTLQGKLVASLGQWRLTAKAG